MSRAGYTLGHETARRVVRGIHTVEDSPRDETGISKPLGHIPRDYRDFELTEELSGGVGATAAVKWLDWNAVTSEFVDSGEVGEVFDQFGNSWGISGERGEARFLGGIWVVSTNPGRLIYRGKLDADLNSGSSATMSIWAGDPLADTGDNVTVYDSSTLPMITAGNKIASGTGIAAEANNGKLYLFVPYDCEEAQ